MSTNTTAVSQSVAGTVRLSQKARELLGLETVAPLDNGMGAVVHAMKFR